MSERTLSPEEARELLAREDLQAWRVEEEALKRTFATEGWPTTLMLVNAIGYLCEAAWHHADLHASYNRVVVTLRTHSADGLTMKDIELARKIEEVVMWRPDPDAALSGVPRTFVE